MTDQERLAQDLEALSLRAKASAVRRGTASIDSGLKAITGQIAVHEKSPYMGPRMKDWCEKAKAILSTYGVGV